MKILHGDLLAFAEAGEFEVIIHGCNCLCNMGSGIALTIKNKYPAVYEADLATKKGDKQKLGTYTFAKVGNDSEFIVVNAYTQYAYSRDKVDVDYDAIRQVFRKIKQDFPGKKIGYPLIGAGLAGGDWNIIESIIVEELRDEDHTLVKFVPS